MNVHSLVVSTMLETKPPRQVDRRPQILDAAERCFSHAGFHHTTMQDIARESGMVPGNLYRYFPSKDAMIAGLIERDRAAIAADFAALSDATNLISAFEQIGRKHLVEQPREKAVLALQIWAEAARNPDIAALCATIHREVRNGIITVCQQSKRSGDIHPDVDVDALASLILTLSDGLIRRRAIDRDFDSGREVDTVMCLIGALLNGAVALSSCHSDLTTGI